MHRKSKRFLSVLLSLFMCFSHLVTDVRAEGEEPEPTPVEVTEEGREEEPIELQEEEPEEVLEGEPEGNQGDESPGETTGVLCWNGTYAETLEGCLVETEESVEPSTPEETIEEVSDYSEDRFGESETAETIDKPEFTESVNEDMLESEDKIFRY